VVELAMSQARLPIAEPKRAVDKGRWPLSRWILWLCLAVALGIWIAVILTG
jgi:hypothetical protein